MTRIVFSLAVALTAIAPASGLAQPGAPSQDAGVGVVGAAAAPESPAAAADGSGLGPIEPESSGAALDAEPTGTDRDPPPPAVAGDAVADPASDIPTLTVTASPAAAAIGLEVDGTSSATSESPSAFHREIRAAFVAGALAHSDPLDADEVYARGTAALRFGILLSPHVELDLELGVSGAPFEEDRAASLAVVEVLPGLRSSFFLRRIGLATPYATVGVSAVYAFANATLSSMSASGDSWGVGGEAAAGVELAASDELGIGVFSELGYAARTPFSVSLRSDGGQSVDMGTLERSGVVWRIGVRIGRGL